MGVDIDGDGVNDYTTTADENGAYSLEVTEPLANGEYPVTATDINGNTGPATNAAVADNSAPNAPVITDTVENADGSTTITGTAEAGSTVGVDLNNDGINDYTTTADNQGNFSLVVSELSANGDYPVTATDINGNTGPATNVTITDTTVPTGTVTDVKIVVDGSNGGIDDGFINNLEKGTAETTDVIVNIDGAVIGDIVGLDIGNNGTYDQQIIVSQIDITNGYVTFTNVAIPVEGDQLVVVGAITKDNAGNIVENPIRLSDNAKVDTTAPTGTVTDVRIVVDENGDNFINKAEKGGLISTDIIVDINGVIAGDVVGLDTNSDGSYDKQVTVSVTDIENGYVTFTDISLPAEGKTLAVRSAVVKDIAGNTVTGSNLIVVSERAEVDTVVPVTPELSVRDNVGTIKGLIDEGDITNDAQPNIVIPTLNSDEQVVLYIDDNLVSFIDNGDGTISPKTPLEEGSHTIQIAIKDAAGNQSETSDPLNFTVDTTPPTLSIDIIANDDVINSIEDNTDITITGSSTGLKDGSIVTVSLNGKNYEGSVLDSKWSVVLPADDAQQLEEGTPFKVTATASDIAGNSADTTTRTIKHITETSASITLNDIAGDNIINAFEDDSPVEIRGTSANLVDGTVVKVTIHSQTYEGTFINNQWSVSMPADDAQLLPEDELQAVIVTAYDVSGNPVTISGTVTHAAISPDNSISIDPITGDNIINAFEDDNAVTITGKVKDVPDGREVTVIINGQQYIGKVANNAWSVTMPAADAQALPENVAQTVEVSTTNSTGNPVTASGTVKHITTTSATIALDPIAGDNVINSTEDDFAITIKGTATNLADGTQVTVNINGNDYTGEVIGNLWSVTMPVADAQSLPLNQELEVKVSAADTRGNLVTTTSSIMHDAIAPTGKVTEVNILLDSMNATGESINGGDGFINKAEKGNATTTEIKVLLDDAVAVGDVIDLDINNDGTADKSITLDASNVSNRYVIFKDVTLPSDGQTLTVKAAVARDAVGNIVAEADRYVATDTAKIDTTAPIGKVTAVDIRLDNEGSAGTAVTGGDGYINALEKGAATMTDVKVSFNANVVAGDIVSLDSNGDGNYDKQIVVKAADISNGRYVTFTGVQLPTEGNSLNVRASIIKDEAGNMADSPTSIIDTAIIDTIAPQGVVVKAYNTGNGQLTLNSKETGTVIVEVNGKKQEFQVTEANKDVVYNLNSELRDEFNRTNDVDNYKTRESNNQPSQNELTAMRAEPVINDQSLNIDFRDTAGNKAVNRSEVYYFNSGDGPYGEFNPEDKPLTATNAFTDWNSNYKSEGGVTTYTTSFKNNNAQYLYINGDFDAYSGATDRFRVEMGAGNDVIDVTGKIENSIQLYMGAGDDVVILNNFYNNDGGRAIIDLGTGNNRLTQKSTGGNDFDIVDINAGEGNDEIIATALIRDSNLNLGNGNNIITAERNFESSTITTGSGEDVVTIKGDIRYSSKINMGLGKDILNIGGSVFDSSKIDMGEGIGEVTIGGNIYSNETTLSFGSANDKLTVTGRMYDGSSVNLGLGDDVVLIKGNMDNSS